MSCEDKVMDPESPDLIPWRREHVQPPNLQTLEAVVVVQGKSALDHFLRHQLANIQPVGGQVSTGE